MLLARCRGRLRGGGLIPIDDAEGEAAGVASDVRAVQGGLLDERAQEAVRAAQQERVVLGDDGDAEGLLQQPAMAP